MDRFHSVREMFDYISLIQAGWLELIIWEPWEVVDD